jgi:predicted hydrocarbon binding protein
MVTENDLVKFCAEAQAIGDEYMAKHYPNNKRDTVSFEIGKRYARVFKVDGYHNGRSAYCFIDMTNGNILKAAGWKAPAPNGVRGHISKGAASCCTWNGVAYLR